MRNYRLHLDYTELPRGRHPGDINNTADETGRNTLDGECPVKQTKQYKIMYVILIHNRRNMYDRTWCTRGTLEEAKKVAEAYTVDNEYQVQIYEMGKDLAK